MISRLLKPPDPTLFFSGFASREEPAISMRYLGTAGFVVEGDGHTVVLDPFISRPSVRSTLSQPLVPNAELIAKHIPRADTVLVGHSHHDHILDAPTLCQQTGATLVTSTDGCNVGLAAGLPANQMIAMHGGDEITRGAVRIQAVESRHGRVYFGRIAYPGDIPEPPPWPPRTWHLRHGKVLNWAISQGGIDIVHIDSADFLEEHLQGHRADVVCLCAVGRQYRPNYVQDVVRILKPRWVIPCHWDWFFEPFDSKDHRVLPGVDLPGMLDEIRNAGAEPALLPIGDTIEIPKTQSSV